MLKSMLIAAILGLCMRSKKAPLALTITSVTAIAAVAYVSTYRDFGAEQVLLSSLAGERSRQYGLYRRGRVVLT
ncbi:hypothetical protein, partial [Methylorubrum extorquens]